VLVGKHADEIVQAKLSSNISFFLGSHPIPTQQSIDSTRQLVNYLKNVKERDLVICLISGGGSALMTLPYASIDLADMQETTRLLLASGATINEMNTIRKHLDQVKGGGLARLVAPATLITMVLSDVIGDDLDVIASGPTVADSSTFQEAWQVIRKYHLEKQLPTAVIGHIKKGLNGRVPETVKNI
jgi:hydroxypyruvate reductase